MIINTSKKIKKVSYNQVNIPSGVDVSNVTATKSDVLGGKLIVDNNGNIQTGTIQTYTDATSRTSNGTFSTANKYLTSDLTVNVNGSGQIYRHINPTIIRVTTINANTTIRINYKTKIIHLFNWGDGSSVSETNSNNSYTYKSHTYSTAGTYNIIISPKTTGNNSWLLTDSNESNDLITFDEYMFNQSPSSSFGLNVSIIVGDGVAFYRDALSYCSSISTLDLTNMNSLLENRSKGNYYTFKTLPTYLCQYSTIYHLVLGSGIKTLTESCFRYSTVYDMIILDARTSGSNAGIISISTANALPTTITGHIYIHNFKLNTYKQASNWSSKSSYMIGY